MMLCFGDRKQFSGRKVCGSVMIKYSSGSVANTVGDEIVAG